MIYRRDMMEVARAENLREQLNETEKANFAKRRIKRDRDYANKLRNKFTRDEE